MSNSGTPQSRGASPQLAGTNSVLSNVTPESSSTSPSPSSTITPVRHVSQLLPVHIKALNKEYRNQVQQASQSPKDSEEQREHYQRAKRIQILLQQYEENKKKTALAQGQPPPAASPTRPVGAENSARGISPSPVPAPAPASATSTAPPISRSQTASPALSQPRASPGVSSTPQTPGLANRVSPQVQSVSNTSSVASAATAANKNNIPSAKFPTTYRASAQPVMKSPTTSNITAPPLTSSISSPAPSNTTANKPSTNSSVSSAFTPAIRGKSPEELVGMLKTLKDLQNDYDQKLVTVENILKNSPNMSASERQQMKQQELNIRTMRDQTKTSVLTLTQEIQRSAPSKSYSQKPNTTASSTSYNSSVTAAEQNTYATTSTTSNTKTQGFAPGQQKTAQGTAAQQMMKANTQYQPPKTTPQLSSQAGNTLHRSQSYQQMSQQKSMSTSSTPGSAHNIGATSAQSQARTFQNRQPTSAVNTPRATSPTLKGPVPGSAASQIRRTESTPYLSSSYNTGTQGASKTTASPNMSTIPGTLPSSSNIGAGSTYKPGTTSYTSSQNVNNVQSQQFNKIPPGGFNKNTILNNKPRPPPVQKVGRPTMTNMASNQKRPSISSVPGAPSPLSNTSGPTIPYSSHSQAGGMNSGSIGLSGSSGFGHSVPASATPLPLPIADKVYNKRKIHELIKDLTPEDLDGTIDNDVDDLIGDLIEEFVSDVTKFACKIAKHRKSEHVEIKDTQLHLERNWNIRVPGHLPDDVPVLKRPAPTKSFIHKLDALALNKTFGSNPLAYGGGANGSSAGGPSGSS